jgi:hypothetical protein
MVTSKGIIDAGSWCAETLRVKQGASMGTPQIPTDQDTEVRDLVSKTLDGLQLSGQGWRIESLAWRERNLAVIRVNHPGLGTFAVELFDESAPYGAYARGALYGSATRRGPGLLDVGEETTSQEARSAAYALCSGLSERTSGPTISQAASPVLPPPPQGLSGADLGAVIREALALSPVLGLDTWAGPSMRVMTRWGEVAEVEYTRDGSSLVFIISERDDARSTFVRGHSYELVYYSDDLAPEEHQALYQRDTDAIEAFARWFRSWDTEDDAP